MEAVQKHWRDRIVVCRSEVPAAITRSLPTRKRNSASYLRRDAANRAGGAVTRMFIHRSLSEVFFY